MAITEKILSEFINEITFQYQQTTLPDSRLQLRGVSGWDD